MTNISQGCYLMKGQIPLQYRNKKGQKMALIETFVHQNFLCIKKVQIKRIQAVNDIYVESQEKHFALSQAQ